MIVRFCQNMITEEMSSTDENYKNKVIKKDDLYNCDS